MKNFFRTTTALFCLIMFTTCQKEPNATFITSKTRAAVGEQITFENRSNDGRSYEWDFGDGTTSTEENPTKTYEKEGQYAVKLTAYSKNKKKSNQEVENITITPAPFVGTHAIVSNWNSSECKNGSSTYTSGPSNYNLVVRRGATNDEIIIDNLANLGINGVRCRVTTIMYFFGMDLYDFRIISGQTLKDKNGITWTYATTDITGEYDGVDRCNSFNFALRRTVLCGGSNVELTYNEYSDVCY